MSIRFQRDRECAICIETRPLLMPVAIETPYGGCVVPLCLQCRVNWRDDQSASLATTLLHAKTPETP